MQFPVWKCFKCSLYNECNIRDGCKGICYKPDVAHTVRFKLPVQKQVTKKPAAEPCYMWEIGGDGYHMNGCGGFT